MKITQGTGVIAIFGDPIGQTLSPAIQNAAIDAAGLDMVYVPFHVTPSALPDAVRAVRALGLRGVNITIPHKELVIGLLDEVTEHARSIGAVNTIVNEGGRLIGHNTDGEGYVRSLVEDTGFNAAGRRIVVLGAGGAARAVVSALTALGPESVLISNRSIERAHALAADFNGRGNADVKAVPFEKGALREALAGAALIVNTTSLGMHGKPPMNMLVLSLDAMATGAVASDIVYRPFDTAFLKGARRAGLVAHHGLGMLIHQGAVGFELWTGRRADVTAMRRAACAALEIDPR